MRIWLLQSSEPMPIVNPEMRLLRTGMMAEELSKRGHEVIWFANSFDHFTKTQKYFRDTIIQVKDNYKLYLFHAIRYKKNISVSRIINHKTLAVKFKKQSKIMEKPDLIYASFPTIDYAIEAVKYGKKNNIPVIVDIRDLWPDIFKHNLSKLLYVLAFPYVKYMDIQTEKIMKNAYAINGTSEAIVNWGLNKVNRKKDIYDRYFYIGYSKENISEKKINEKLIDTDKFNISFFATINNQFNYDLIVDLATKLKNNKDIIINICGDGPQFKYLEDKVKKLENVKLFGWTSKDKLSKILSDSKVGLAPYKNTFDFQMSVSNKFAEYLAYGLPIIITCDGNMKKILEVNKCGIGSQNVDDICKFIVNLKKDKNKYNDESKNAEKLFEENFVASDIYKNIVDYLESIGDERK